DLYRALRVDLWLRASLLHRVLSAVPRRSLRRCGLFGRRLLLGGGHGGKIPFADPAGPEARLHDHRPAFGAGEFEAIEGTGVVYGLVVLALAPAGEIIGGTAGEILDSLDAVLAERDQHFGGDGRDLLESILDTEFVAARVKLRLDLRQVVARALLQLARRFLVKPFDRAEFLFVH